MKHDSIALAVTLAAIVVPAFAEIPNGVSPGAVDGIAEIEGRCPTFSWEAVAGAAFFELVAYRLQGEEHSASMIDVDLSAADEVLYKQVPGRATGWTPALAECLEPGERHVWFVRAVFRQDQGQVVQASEWSEGRFFSISPMPSAQEVEEALSVLRRYVGWADSGVVAINPQAGEAEATSRQRPTARRPSAVPPPGPKSVLSAKTAIRGSLSDLTGETYGIVGVSASTDGAGLGAANTAGGPDLVLDGSAQGVVDTELSESGIDRPSSGPQSFDITNSGAGDMELRVDGVEVVTIATDQDTLGGLSCANDEVAKWNGSSWLCADDENDGLTLPFEDSDPTAGAAFKITNTSTSGNVFAVRGQNESIAGAGVFGWSTANTGYTSGVVGQSSSGVGTGVFGVADHTSGANYGVGGVSSSTNGTGVAGYATATSGDTTGVLGQADGTSGETYGVVGISHSTDGAGVRAAGAVGGPDLVLDGSADSATDAVLTQDGIYRISGLAQTFTIANPGAGTMTLEVDGAISGNGPLSATIGLMVSEADNDGVRITQAGTPSDSESSPANNGFEVGGAEGNGLYVGRADNHGIHIESTGNDGVRVDEALQDGVQIGDGIDSPLYGVYIAPPGVPYTALWPNTSNTNGEWGLYTPDKIYAANVTTSTLTLVARVASHGSLTAGDLVTVVGMADPLPNTLSAVPLVDRTDGSSSTGVIGIVESRMALQQAVNREDGVLTLRSVPGPAQDGDYVGLIVIGIAQVKVDPLADGINPGQRLTVSEVAGHTRLLRSETLNGMVVTEGTPVIGIALAAPVPGETTIPVFVTLR